MTAALETLQSSLNNELNLVQRFIDILRVEADALDQPDKTDLLNNSTQEKNNSIEQLAKAGKARENALMALDYAPSRAGLEEAAQTHPELGPACRQLFELGQEASRLNAANGAAIDTYLRHTQQALQALQPLVGGSGLYDASGKPGAIKGQRKTITAG
ncbi:flagella synthesis protein FlgN [Pusillimonas sp.]|uniref:flagella synthesis protein FlgN n=1 Tax=Pusillimonas sp. TaxID=3040095 RepID=UPI0037C9B17D